MIKKIPSDAMPITIRGMKKIEDDDELMELSEYIGIYSDFHTIPKKIVFTKKIGNTEYDVICEGIFVDKYIVYEDVAFENKHIVFSPEWIFTFADQDMVANEKCPELDTKYEYSIQKSIAEMQENIQEYLNCYGQVKQLDCYLFNELTKEDYNVIKHYIDVLNGSIPANIVDFYKDASSLLNTWIENFK